jgi:hypothetical protein
VKSSSIALLCVAALCLPGCIIVDDRDENGGPSPLGTLTVEWTIDGRVDPVECNALRADRLELLVFDDRGDLVLEAEPRCGDFGVSMELLEGRYEAEATLTDDFDRAATLTEDLADIDVITDTELVISVNFPLGSFL